MPIKFLRVILEKNRSKRHGTLDLLDAGGSPLPKLGRSECQLGKYRGVGAEAPYL